MTCEKCRGYTHPSRCPFCSKSVKIDDPTTLELLQYIMKLEERIIALERAESVVHILPSDSYYWEHG